MKKILTILLFLISISTAETTQTIILNVTLAADIKLILEDGYVLVKPPIDSTAILDAEQQGLVKKALTTGRGLIFNTLVPAKNDYVSEKDRGTVFYNPKHRNYSFQKVIIPDSTVVKNSNFTQVNMNTNCIIGNHITFEDCNMWNVKWNTTWINKNNSSNNCQKDLK